ncbi:uncharacterized protein LOC118200953 [Stegodyphus dumicola]|uniref:uncharacterized protein LOC118200953 n=1 Tax=Stegodyphus dumicola TaxID=202533 RepID=UPI0015A863DF|nr:uncharacterized protein LOC118200953 [Stegodyphus dumicola]
MLMATSSLSLKEFGRRFRKALSVPFLLNQVCSTNIQEFVESYAASLGCSEKSLFFPLLTCAAACMGTDCYIELTSHWHEPPILWTLVITPKTLLRIDVAEHLKQLLLKAQNEVWVLEHSEDTKDHLRKFLFDLLTLDQLHEMLKLSNGHGLAIYNSVRSLHKVMVTPEDADIMFRLYSGLGWFADSRVTRNTVSKTRVNFSIISTPTNVHQALTTSPNFPELFHQCFLTTCSEENHVKFGQLSVVSETEKLLEIFTSLLKLHSMKGPIVYKLSSEATEKFSQIHDELTDKAKQMARKNAHKVFQPALSYLGRLSCVLHVLDNVLESINYKVPITQLTWSTEISASTVWQARELLGHVVEQRHALMEQTMIEASQPKNVRTPAIDLVDGQTAPRQQRSPYTAHTPPINSMQRSPVPVQRPPFSPSIARRNLMNTRVRTPTRGTFEPLLNQSNERRNVEPIIASVSSAGLPVTREEPAFRPVISSCETLANSANNSLNAELNLPPTLSVSVSDESEPSQPVLLSRTPFTSVRDVSKEDFLKSHRSSVRKLLMHGISQISASRCVQLKLTPDPTASEEGQIYNSSFARSFLKKLESLGFGVCDGPKSGNLRHFIFKKKKFSALTEEQKQILSDINISERDYNKCFTLPAVQESKQNGSVVCLE